MLFMQMCASGPKGILNPLKSLCRFQFLEALARLACKRWKDSGECDELGALGKMAEALVPKAGEAQLSSQAMHARMWCEQVEDAVLVNEDELKAIFKCYSGKEDKLCVDKRMSYAEWAAFADRCHLVTKEGGELGYVTDRESEISQCAGFERG